jgi:hypothetical protein
VIHAIDGNFKRHTLPLPFSSSQIFRTVSDRHGRNVSSSLKRVFLPGSGSAFLLSCPHHIALVRAHPGPVLGCMPQKTVTGQERPARPARTSAGHDGRSDSFPTSVYAEAIQMVKYSHNE